MKNGAKSKHISEADAVTRAKTDDLIRLALLAICAGQGGKTIEIPIEDANRLWETHTIQIERDETHIKLTATKMPSKLVKSGLRQ